MDFKANKLFSIAEQFGGAGILFLMLPFVSREVGTACIGFYFLTQTVVSVATIYTGGVVLRSKTLGNSNSGRFSLISEAKRSLTYLTVIFVVVLIYINSLLSNGDPYQIGNNAFVYGVCVFLIVWLDIQSATLNLLLKTNNRFLSAAAVEIINKALIVTILIALYFEMNSYWAGPLSIVIAQLVRFGLLWILANALGKEQINELDEQITKQKKENKDVFRTLIYGLISYAVANGERLFSGLLGEADMSAVFAITMLPTLIPSILNAIRVTGIAQNVVLNDGRNERQKFSAGFRIDMCVALVLMIIVYFINTFYYSRFEITGANLNVSLVNLLVCLSASLQACNVYAFYKVVVDDPGRISKIVCISGIVYVVTGAALVPYFGVYGVLSAKIFFNLSMLLVVPAALSGMEKKTPGLNRNLQRR